MRKLPRVLVVEDEPAIAELIAVNLRHNGFAPTVVFDGQAAQREVDAVLPDVILLDWMLPGESGASLARQWRKHERTKTVPILMLTARSDESDKVQGLDAGADDYITKPFSTQELLARIRAVLRRRAPEIVNDSVQVGELSLDAATYRITFRGLELKVGPTEFKLLHYLMKHAERVHTRGTLLDKIWGDHVFIEERTVDVHVKRLRESLGEAARMVETVRGAGYRLTTQSSAGADHAEYAAPRPFMIGRVLGLLLLVLLGAAWGWSRASLVWAVAGALLGAMAWGIQDSIDAARLLRWLNKGDVTGTPNLKGVWGELLDRNRKIFKKLEKKAQSSDARLEDFLSAIQASPNGVVLLDANGCIEWSNLTAAGHLGFDAQRDLGQYVRNMVRSPVFMAYMSEGNFGHEIQIDGPGPRPSQPNRISLQIHPYGKKRKLMITRDVTALQLAETMRRDFVANVSHEIRTPLTVLSGFVETMQSIPLDETDRVRYLGLMSQQAQRMQTLVSDLLTLSRLEGSPAPGTGEWIDASDLLAQVVQEAEGLSQTIAHPPHVITPQPGPGLRVSGVRSELLSATSNLLSNAVRYTSGGGVITCGWRLRPDGAAEFYVADSGPGIAAEHLPRLTERFYRVDRSRSRETGGTGLGLAIVKHVAQRHGGQIQVDSVVGQGSTFTLILPPTRVQECSAD